MKSFSYVATTTAGKQVRGTINAEDVRDFTKQAKEKGLTVTKYEEKEIEKKKTIKKLNTKDLAFNCRQLAAMLTSGLTLVKALDILSKEQPTEDAKQLWQDVYENVQKGESFSDSLVQYRGVFPEFMISMVSAGESSGSLDKVTQDLSDYYQKQNKMNNTIKGAMTYPIILGVIMLAVVIGLPVFILPTFVGMYDDPADIPALTKVLMTFSDSLIHYWYIYIAVVIGIIFGMMYMLKIPSTRIKWDKLIIKGPGFGPLVVKIYTARFANTMASLYSSGISMVDCLKRSSAILGNSYISQCFEQVIDEVKQGETLSSSIQRTEIFDSMFCSIIFVGEEAGALDSILTKTGEYYDEEADSAINSLVGMLEPLMIVIMGIAVGVLLAAIFPALYGSFDAVAG